MQWVPIASSPIGRNTGEVLGVFGEARLSAPEDRARRFTSSVRFRDLVAMEDGCAACARRAWPEAVLGSDRPRAVGGRPPPGAGELHPAATTCRPSA